MNRLSLAPPVPIATPPWTTLGKKLESLCRKALYEYRLLEGIDKLAVALSGGKDSLALLFLLKAILGRGMPDIPLIALHVSGVFSCGAQLSSSYLSAVCEKLGVPLVTIPSLQKVDELECYSCSRNRRKLLFEAAKKEGAQTIAFGHHRDDSVQTLLLNLLHKAEFAANLPKVPMEDYGVTIIRPLIYVAEAQIIEFAKLHGFHRITCQCPVGQNSLRKRTEILLQHIETIFPHARENLAQAGRQYGSDKALRK